MSSLLLDSHTLLWFAWGDPKLSANAQALIEEPSLRKLVSVATCWEITIKAGLGKIKLGVTSQEFLSRALAITGFELLPIALEHATFVEKLPPHHRDPFDRLLVAQALVEGLSIVSADALFDAYGARRCW